MTLDTRSELFRYARKAADASGVAVLLVHDAHILYANLEASALTGWANEALYGRPITELMDLPQSGTRHALRHLRCADGMRREVACSVSVIDEGLLMVTLIPPAPHKVRSAIEENVSAAQRALSSSEVNYARILENLTEAACIIDSQGIVISTNGRCASRSGYTPSQVIGSPLAKAIHPDDVAWAEHAFATTDATGKPQQITYRIISASGDTLTIESYVHRLEHGRLLLLSHVADEPMHVLQESVQNNLELEQSLNIMRRTLLRMIVHEMRTPLAVIMTSSEIMGRYHDKITDDKRSLYMNRIRAQVEYLQELMHDILFALGGDQQEEVATQFAVDDTCQRIFRSVQRTFEHRFVLEIQGETFAYYGVERYVARVVYNLLALAVKHTEPSTEVKLLLSEHRQEYCLVMTCNASITPQSMNDAILLTHPHIALSGKPLFGLGMVILQDYVRRLNGRITVYDIHRCDAIAVFWPKFISLG